MSLTNKTDKRQTLLRACVLLLVFTGITSAITGILVSLYYIPTPQKAALSIVHIQENVFAGAVIISLHRLCGLVLPFLVISAMISVSFTQDTSAIRTKVWRTSVWLLLLAACFIITGYILSGHNTSVFLLKGLITKISGAKSISANTSSLVDPLSFSFIRVFLLHVMLLPIAAAALLCLLRKNSSAIQPGHKPITFPLYTLYAPFCGFITVLAFYLNPAKNPVASYTEDYFDRLPGLFKLFISLSRTLSFPMTMIVCFLTGLLLFYAPDIIRKLKK